MELKFQMRLFQLLENILQKILVIIIVQIHRITILGKRAKNAQEAHEAIRPTDVTRSPLQVKKFLSSDQFNLYELIWNRALSSQMQNAEFDRNTITISSTDNKIKFRATGSVIKFDGFLKLYDYSENILKEKTFYLLLTKEKLKLIKS